MNRILLLVLGAALALPVLSAAAALPETDAVLAGAAYLRFIQGPDGTYGTSSPGQNMDSIYAVRAAGYDPAKDLVGGLGPLQYLTANADAVSSPAEAAKAALAAKALGIDPKSVGGTNLIARIEAGYNAADGTYGSDDFSQSIAMLGLACTGNAVPTAAVGALEATQLDSGGWGFGGTADPDTTAIVIQALVAAGVSNTDDAVDDALAFLKAGQGDDGGWGYDVAASNVSSTAFVVQALLALGENPEAAQYTKSGVTPVGYLLSQQLTNGSFQGFDPTYSTNQVLPALAGRTFCNAPETPIVRSRPVAAPTATPTAVPTAAPSPAPLPPSAGTGPSGDQGPTALYLAAGLLLAGIGGGALAAHRQRA